MTAGTRTENGFRDEVGPTTLVVAGSGVLAVVAVFLPWVQWSALGQTASANGLDVMEKNVLCSGAVTALLGVVAIVLAVAASGDGLAGITGVVAGVVVAGVGATFFIAPEVALGARDAFGSAFARAGDPTVGVYLTVLAGVGMAGGGALGLAE